MGDLATASTEREMTMADSEGETERPKREGSRKAASGTETQ